MKKTLMLCAVLILTGCAARQKTFIAIPESVQTQINSTDVYLVDCPDKMDFDVEDPNTVMYSGGGLLFALLDAAIVSSRRSSGEKALKCVQERLKDMPIQTELHKKLTPLLQKTKWLKTNPPY